MHHFISLLGTGTNPAISMEIEEENLDTPPMEGQIYRFLPPALDLTISALLEPSVEDNCLGDSSVLQIELRNTGTDTFDFTSNPQHMIWRFD